MDDVDLNDYKYYEEYDDDYKYNDDEDDIKIQQGVNEYLHTYNATAIELVNFNLAEIDNSNPYAMKKQRMIEGEEKFFLRQLIYAFKYMKYTNEVKFNIQEQDFYKLLKILKQVTFPYKKSPFGLLLAYWMHNPDSNEFIKVDRFNKVMGLKGNEKLPSVNGNSVVPLNYMYKVYASDLIRYVKMFNELSN